MKPELYGYSERGLVNALCYDCFRSPDGVKCIGELLNQSQFPLLTEKPDFTKLSHATLFVEQSLSEFGESDLIVLCEWNEVKAVVFCEFKRGRRWKLRREWLRFA